MHALNTVVIHGYVTLESLRATVSLLSRLGPCASVSSLSPFRPPAPMSSLSPLGL